MGAWDVRENRKEGIGDEIGLMILMLILMMMYCLAKGIVNLLSNLTHRDLFNISMKNRVLCRCG